MNIHQFIPANLMKMVARQAPTYLGMVKPLGLWGVPLCVGAVWFTWPAGSGAFLFGVGVPKEDE